MISTKFLGATLDEYLNSMLHVRDDCWKVAKFIPILCSVRQYIDDVAVNPLLHEFFFS